MPYVKSSEWTAIQDKIAELEKRPAEPTAVVQADDPFEGLKQAIAEDAEEVDGAEVPKVLPDSTDESGQETTE